MHRHLGDSKKINHLKEAKITILDLLKNPNHFPKEKDQLILGSLCRKQTKLCFYLNRLEIKI